MTEREALLTRASAALEWSPAGAERTLMQSVAGVRWVQRPVMQQLRAASKPVFATKAGHASEVLGVVRHENHLLSDRVRCDHGVETVDGRPFGGQ